MVRSDEIERVHAFVDGWLSQKEKNEFWMEVAANRETRTLFFMVLTEKFNNNALSPQLKELTVKLYKESPEFKALFFHNESVKENKKQAQKVS